MPDTTELVRKISDTSSGISIKGHRGKWYVIASEEFSGDGLYLLEHETYGDETACLIVDENGNIKLDNVFNGFDDYREFLAVTELNENEIKEDTMARRGSFTQEDYNERITLANSVSIVDYARKNGLEITFEDESLAITIDPDTDRNITLYKENNSWRLDKEPGEADKKDITYGNTIRFVARIESIYWKDAVEKLVMERGQYLSVDEYNSVYENKEKEKKVAPAAAPATEMKKQQPNNQSAPSSSAIRNPNIIEFPNSRLIENPAGTTIQRPPIPMVGFRRTFSKEQLAEILTGIKKGINVAPFDNVFLVPEQMKQVRLGIQNGIDTKPYNFPFVPAEYMKEVRLSIQKGLDISFLAINNNVCIFTADQAREIRKGQENGLSLDDIKFYAKPYLTPEAMKEMRIGLQDGFNQMKDLNAGNYNAKDIHTIRMTLTINRLLNAISTQLKNLFEKIVEFFYKVVESNHYEGTMSDEDIRDKAVREKEAIFNLKETVTNLYNSLEESMEDIPITKKESVVADLMEQLINKADAMERSTETDPVTIMKQSMNEIIDAQEEFALQQRALENLKDEYINDFYSFEDNNNIRQVEFSTKVMSDNSLTQIQKDEIIIETLGSMYGDDVAQAWSSRIQTETEFIKDDVKMNAFMMEFEKQQMRELVEAAMEYDMER